MKYLVIAFASLIALSLVVVDTSWWSSEPERVSFPEKAVGLCYPWLVLEHTLYNLATGEIQVGTGGDSAEYVDTCSEVIVVKAVNGAYVFSRNTGLLVDVVFTSRSLRFISSTSEALFIYDTESEVLYVKIIGSGNTAIIPAPGSVSVSATMVQGMPIAVYSVREQTGVFKYIVANPVKTTELGVHGSGAVLSTGDRVFVESNGVAIYRVSDSATLTITLDDYIPLPVSATRFVSVRNNYLYMYVNTVLVRVNIDKQSSLYKTVEVVGEANASPVGYYVPATDTSFVDMNEWMLPVPGYAVGRLENSVFTNIVVEKEVKSVLWSVTPTTLVVTSIFNGYMYDGGFVVRITLPLGTYVLPRNTVLTDGAYTIVLTEPEHYYPPRTSSSPNPPRDVADVMYVVQVFPSNYVPLHVFENVKHVSPGSSKLLVIQRDKAVVVSEYGVSATIPGVWFYGGVGDCVVLYDGASLRLYDYAGAVIDSYSYYKVLSPNYITCVRNQSDYVVQIYTESYEKRIDVSKRFERIVDNPEKKVVDPSGLAVYYGDRPRAEYAGVEVPIQTNIQYIHVSGFSATWSTGTTVYILSLVDSAIYILLDAPVEAVFYPVSRNIVAIRRGDTVEVVSYIEWFLQDCYIDIRTDRDATVRVNNRDVSTGSTRVFVKCGSTVEVEVSKPYHKSKSTRVYVYKPVVVELYPEPIIAEVVLKVDAPAGLLIESLRLRIDGVETTWRVNETRKMLAKPIKVDVVEYLPDNLCRLYSFTISLVEGRNTLEVKCVPETPIIVLKTRVSARLEIYREREQAPLLTLSLSPERQLQVAVDTGSYRILSHPLVENYVVKEINMSIYTVDVYVIDATPIPFSRLVVETNIQTAVITVYNETWVTVASGVGRLEVHIPPGNYVVAVQAHGYQPYIQPVTLPPGEAVFLKPTLVPEAVAPMPHVVEEQPVIGIHLIVIPIVIAAGFLIFMIRRRFVRKEEEATETEVA